MGNAEILDGSLLGNMRAVDPQLSKSRYIGFPQITGVIGDDSKFEGMAFGADMISYCNCSDSSNGQDLVIAGVPSIMLSQFESLLSMIDDNPSWVNYVSLDDSDDENPVITIVTTLPGFGICGGLNSTSPSLSVCTTRLTNHTTLESAMFFKADPDRGTAPSSVVPYAITENADMGYEPANMTYLSVAITTFLGGPISYHSLPSHWPGSVNPLLWEASRNMRDISIALIDRGIEVAMAYILRGAILRSYTTSPTFCEHHERDDTVITLRLRGGPYAIGLFWVVNQMVFNFFCMLCFF